MKKYPCKKELIEASIFTALLLMCFQFTLGQLIIIPLGNSITQGNIAWPGANSYRRNLWHKLNNAGYRVDFVGSLDTDNKGRAFPDPTFDHAHEGHWGCRADEILAAWEADSGNPLSAWDEVPEDIVTKKKECSCRTLLKI